MKSEIFHYIKQSSKYWWTSLIVGIIAIILSICCITTPDKALVTISYLFVAGLIVSGIFDIVFAVSNRQIISGWGWTLAGGTLDLLLGLLLAALPLPVITTILIYFVGFWILFRSIWTIGVAAELNNFINAGWLLVFGIFALLFSIFYLFSPVFGGITIIALISVALLFYGTFRIYYAFELKSINKKIKEHRNS